MNHVRLPCRALRLACLASLWTLPAQAQPPQRAPVVVSPVVQREVGTGRTFVGTVVPLKKAVIGAAVDGRVVEVLFEEGDRVQQGEPLAKLLTETISLEIEAAAAELRFREQQLAELENGTRPAEIQRAEAKMLGAEAMRQYQKARRQRVEQLYQARSAVSEENRDEAVSAAIAAEQAFQEAKAAYALAVEGPRPEQIAQAKAQVEMQTALVAKLKDQKTKHTMISRFDGYVIAKHTELGQWVTKGDAVVEVAALDTVEIQAYVPENDIPFVIVGQQVRVDIPALPNSLFTGNVALVIPAADSRARTFPVKIRVENPLQENGPLLKAGMVARVMLPTGASRNALLVHKDALVLGGQQPTVFVVDAAGQGGNHGTVRPVPVQLGVASGLWIQVTGPLEPGQHVVVRGNERLRPGQDIVISGKLPEDAAEPAEAIRAATSTRSPSR